MAPKLIQLIEPLDGEIIKVWTAPSSTEHGTKHYVFAFNPTGAEADDEVSFTCSCKGMQYSGTCWHTDQAREKLDG